MSFPRLLAVLIVTMLFCVVPISASELTPEIRETCLKTRFYVRPAWDDAIASMVSQLRTRIEQARLQGKTVVYISLPLTARAGGLRAFNNYLGLSQKKRLIRQFPNTPLKVILPGQIENMLPSIEGLFPQGGEYMYMWTQVLAGQDCSGDIDWIYYMDFTDVQYILNLHELPDDQKHTEFEKILAYRAVSFPEIYNETYSTPVWKQKFIDYYLNHYSVMNSRGARDEWNIIQMLGMQQSDRTPIMQGFRNSWDQAIKPLVRSGYQQNPVRPPGGANHQKSPLPPHSILHSLTPRTAEL